MRGKVFRLLGVAALVTLGAGCSIRPPKPKPPEPPAPTIPEPQCAEGQHTCCWHQPPGNEPLYACPAPEVPGGVLNVAGGPAQCPGKRCDEPTPPPSCPETCPANTHCEGSVCVPDPPDPPQPPTGDVPPKGVPQGPERLLRNHNNEYFTKLDGTTRVDPFMCVPCCMAWDKCPNQLWPMASECFQHEGGKYGCDTFHFRIGPWFGDAENESEWVEIGGAYNADGSWNTAFWEKVRLLVWTAYKAGRYVEVVAIDSWWLKNACGKDASCGKKVPWPDADVQAYGQTLTEVHKALIRKTVEELGCFGNVIWATGNEEDLIPRMTASYLNQLITEHRTAETEVGCGFGHVMGSGSWKPGVNSDYQITHETTPVTGPCNGKLCVDNEHNPEFSPEQEAQLFEQARSQGQVWAAWRAGAEDAEWEKRLELFQAIVGGGSAAECFPPADDDNLWVKLAPQGGDRADEVKAGEAELGSMCKEPRDHENGNIAIAALNAKLRGQGYCAGTVGAVDHVMILSEHQDGNGTLWEEHHAVAPYDTGCWSTSNNHYPLNRFRYTGPWTPPAPPADGCSNPDPLPVSKWNVKEHTRGPNWVTIDSTPLACDPNYCALIGFTDGRQCCSIRQEGDPQREACEAEVVGLPKWTGPTGGQVMPGNPYQYRVPTGTTGEVKVCTSVQPQVCGSMIVQ